VGKRALCIIRIEKLRLERSHIWERIFVDFAICWGKPTYARPGVTAPRIRFSARLLSFSHPSMLEFSTREGWSGEFTFYTGGLSEMISSARCYALQERPCGEFGILKINLPLAIFNYCSTEE
jgi:hypothetical protein